MKKITLQDIFDAAWRAFIVEGKPPAQEAVHNNVYHCRYLTDDGRRCAVGLVLPYRVARESAGTFSQVLNRNPQLFAEEVLALPDVDLDLFQSKLHDSLCGDGGWHSSLEEREAHYRWVARAYSLKVPGDD